LKQFVERVDRTAYDEFYREDETVDHVQSADDPNCPSDTLYKHPTEPKPDTNVSESCRSNLPEPIRPLDLRSFDRAAHCEAVMRAVLQDQLALLLDELAYLYRFGAVSLVRRLRWWYGTTLSEAEIQDACGDAWLAVLEKIQAGHYREISEGLVWKSARRRVLNAIRDRRFREKALRRRYNDCQHQRRTDLESHSPDSRMCSEIDMRRLVDRLPDGEREAISAHFWCGTTASEIAAALGIAEKAAQKRIERGVRRLRPRL